MALGWSLERVAYRPLRNAPRLTPLITAIGMSIVLQNVAMIVWGRNYLTFPHLLPKVNFEFAGAHFTAVQVMIVVVSGLTMGGLVLLVYRTKLGMAMRATAQNPQVASLMGVNSNTTKSPITRWASCSASRRLPPPCSAASATSRGRWPAASCSVSSRRSGRATSAT
jgi:branched-subunit amino acid ABC-type transport system permease component